MASAEEYAAWIVANEAKKGTPEFDIVAKAYQESKAEPAVVQAGNALRDIPRQVGLGARALIKGAATFPVMAADVVAAPLRAATGGKYFEAPSAVLDRTLTQVGLPEPQNATERVTQDVIGMGTGQGVLTAGGRLLSQAAGPVVRRVGEAFASAPGIQAAGAVGAGAAGGSVREAGGSPLEQFGASLVGGLSGAGLSAVAVKAYNGIAGAIGQLLTPRQNMQQINVTLNQILEQNGIDVTALPGLVRAELAHEVRRALDTGGQLNPDVVRRIADYGVVGATPTRGTVTLDPVQVTQERNLSKLGANSTDPRLQELPRIQNANNARFIENLNELGGATRNADPVVAGRQAVGAIAERDAAAQTRERGLYAAARDSSGRSIELDREDFINTAYNRLGESNKGAFLPESIRTLLEQIRTGRVTMPDGSERALPFNVDVIDNLKTTLATASRGAADGNVRAAIAQVRGALENVQPRATGRPVGGNQVVDPAQLAGAQGQADEIGAEALRAFDTARRFARGRRNWQESAPGISAALDDAHPDRFVKDFILSSSNKGGSAEVERVMHTLRRSPEAMQAVKENIVAHFKSKALGGASDEVGNFSQSGYNKALNDFGEAKLRAFFSPEEITQLRTLGRVSSYEMVQPKGSAVNNSNTAGTFAGILDRIASSGLVGKIPFGDAAIRQPARNWSTQIGVSNALDAGGAMVRPSKSPAMLRLEQLLGPGLLLAAPRAEGRDDNRRR